MARPRDLFRAGLASGMVPEDVMTLLLAGSMDLGHALVELLSDFVDHHEQARMAVTALKVTKELETVGKAMARCGLHPLSLLLCSDSAQLAWIRENLKGEHACFAGDRWPNLECQLGRFRVERFHASPWLQATQPGLQLIMGKAADTLVLSDASLTGLFRADMSLEMTLKVMACTGTIDLPARIQGGLQLRFNQAAFRFPGQMALDGCLEIRDCPGVSQLPEELITTLLELHHCPGLRSLPKRILGACQIDLVSLPIHSFPEGIEDVSYLRIANAPNLVTLPLPSGQRLDVDLVRLSALRMLCSQTPCGVRNLLIESCGRLETLPRDLSRLSGNLTLDRLPLFSVLPDALMITGDLQIMDCPRLRALPDDLVVDGSLEIQGCPELTRIPDHLRAVMKPI